MKISTWRPWLGVAALALFAALPARADLVSFEDLDPTLFGGGASVDSGGFNFASSGAGFSGVDTVDSLFMAPPPGASGQFLFALNNDGITMTSSAGEGFRLSSFSAAFIAPLAGLAGVLPGHLTVELYGLGGALVGTEYFDFGIGAPFGDFPFTALSLASTADLSSAYFRACAYQETGECSSDGLVPAQFALDDLNVTLAAAVPEPGSALLVLTALGALVVRRRHALH